MATVVIVSLTLQSLVNVSFFICREIIEELEEQLDVKDS